MRASTAVVVAVPIFGRPKLSTWRTCVVALGWKTTGSVRFNRDTKQAHYPIINCKAVMWNSREAKAAEKAAKEQE